MHSTLQVLKERGYEMGPNGLTKVRPSTQQGKSLQPAPAAVLTSGVNDTPTIQRFVIPGAPIGKPRMTRSDKWKKRECVVRYREWADGARAAAPEGLIQAPQRVDWTAYLPIPESWSKKKKAAMAGQPHQQKPDRDNIDKAILDALWPEDSPIACGWIEKLWDDGNGPRLEVTVYTTPRPV